MSAPSPSVGQLIGHYRIVEYIGKGGMGVVYRAHDQQLDRDVALKVLPPIDVVSEAARKQFRREALSIARINHTNVAMAFEFGQENGIDYLVTEYVPGTTLDLMLSHHPLPEADIVRLGQQLAAGLEAAHREGVLHRDLKPGNLRIHTNGTLKILDFGLALLVSREGEPAATVSVGNPWTMAGTLPYMSPEQLSGASLDVRADVWGAGAVLYHMATGVPPFGQLNGTQLVAAILHHPPSSPRALNNAVRPQLERIILKALEKKPADRFPSAKALGAELENLASGKTKSGGTEFRHKIFWGAATVLIAAVLAALFFLHWFPWPSAKMKESSVVAILPFESVGNDAATNALGLGLTDTVTAKLWQASANTHLQMVSTRELIAQGVKSAEQARREFGSDFVLEGSIQQSVSMIRITYTLIESKTHRSLAAGTVTGDANDLFGLQDRFVDQLLDTLPLVLNSDQRDALKSRHDTQSAAYDYYLRGRGYLEQYQNPENIDKAIQQFEQAIKVDANYAPAYAGSGRAYAIGFQQLNRGKEWLDKARTNCSQALTLAPQLAEGHSCMGKVYFQTGNYENAVQQFQSSIEYDPNSDETLSDLADAYQKLGNPSAAEAAYRKAIALRPNYWGTYSAAGAFYYNQARYQEAARMFATVTELAPDNYRGFSNLGGIYLLQGRYPESIEALQRSIKLRPNSDSYGNLGAAYFYLKQYEDAAKPLNEAINLNPEDWLSWGSLGDVLYWTPGKRDQATQAYQKAIALTNGKLEINPQDASALAYSADYYAMVGDSSTARAHLQHALKLAPSDPDVLFRAAILYSKLGEKSKAVNFLEKAAAGGFSKTMIRDTPNFAPLRVDTKFRELMEKPSE